MGAPLKEQSRRQWKANEAWVTCPLPLARCMSLVGHTSFADHSIRRSRKPWRDVAWQEQAGIALACHSVYVRVYIHTRLRILTEKRDGIRNVSNTSGMRKWDRSTCECRYARIGARRKISHCIIESRSSNRIPCFNRESWALVARSPPLPR